MATQGEVRWSALLSICAIAKIDPLWQLTDLGIQALLITTDSPLMGLSMGCETPQDMGLLALSAFARVAFCFQISICSCLSTFVSMSCLDHHVLLMAMSKSDKRCSHFMYVWTTPEHEASWDCTRLRAHYLSYELLGPTS